MRRLFARETGSGVNRRVAGLRKVIPPATQAGREPAGA